MLLHNSYINVAIPHILVYWKSLYDLRKAIYDFAYFRDIAKRAWPKNQGSQGRSELRFFLVFIETNTNNIQLSLACYHRFPGKTLF